MRIQLCRFISDKFSSIRFNSQKVKLVEGSIESKQGRSQEFVLRGAQKKFLGSNIQFLVLERKFESFDTRFRLHLYLVTITYVSNYSYNDVNNTQSK